MTWFVAVDGVLVDGAGAPGVVAADAVDVAAEVEGDVVALRQLVGMERHGVEVCFVVVPGAEAEGLGAGDVETVTGIIREHEPAQVAAVAVVLRNDVVGL